MRVEEVILRNAHVRGIDKLVPLLPADFCLRAARALMGLLERCDSPVVLITTGFYVGGAPETDGPPGAYFLYEALRRLGFLPKIVTDTICAPLFTGLFPGKDLISVPLAISDEVEFARGVYETYQPEALIAVERCGRTRDGVYRDMRGNDISPFTAPIDSLFLDPPEGCVTVGIGDGGNEIGMGGFADEISRRLSVAPCVVATDYLILSTVSNWGACGLIRYLEILLGSPCLPDWDAVRNFVETIVFKGAVNGLNAKREVKVDGYGLEETRKIIMDLSACVLES